jgi:signal transduction histidine kinase
MSIIIKVLFVISIILNGILLYKAASMKKGINYILGVLLEIRNLGFNRRIHIGFGYKSLEKMSTELNILMDRFENIIEEKEKLELSHKQLIANISHDIRTPLTSLLGFVEVLQNDNGISLEQEKEYLSIIHSKGQSLYNMIEEFFELSKLEAEDTDIRLEKLDLLDNIKEVIAAFYEDFVINNITPEMQLPEESVYVWGNSTSIQRIINNLFSNALKYGKDGGVIGIGVRKDKEKIWVDIWDNGHGIAEKDLPRLFDRLYTAETSRNNQLHGTGLGLAIAKQLAKKQNGEIFVSSVPDEKTMFSFYLIKG